MLNIINAMLVHRQAAISFSNQNIYESHATEYVHGNESDECILFYSNA